MPGGDKPHTAELMMPTPRRLSDSHETVSPDRPSFFSSVVLSVHEKHGSIAAITIGMSAKYRSFSMHFTAWTFASVGALILTLSGFSVPLDLT